MENQYTTPFARWARIFEIIIPIYMFGKSWAMFDERTVQLFQAVFPKFLVDGAVTIRSFLETGGEAFGRFVATYAGTLLGLVVVALLAVVMHLVLRDRKFVDTLRLTSVTLLPLAIMNGTLSHVMKTYLENIDAASATPEALEQAVVTASNNYFYLFTLFYIIALWVMPRRTGVQGWKRWAVIAVGLLFIVAYVQAGLLIDAGEWAALAPQLMESLAQ
jgi:hypothetical protein